MKRKALNTKAIEQLEREAIKVKSIKAKIDQLQRQLENIKNENNWLNYLSPESLSSLTEEENWKLYELHTTISKGANY